MSNLHDLYNWRPASDPPPEGVPVLGIHGDGGADVFEYVADDDAEGMVWARCYNSPFCDGDQWFANGSEWDDDYTVRYWHPLPDVPTLAELDGDGTGGRCREWRG